ncbi:SWIM zinc finger family protein [Paenibacillus alginolyticus]|uniref:SWIM-type domain-containing protein n=1 Tax=Paenibacillus alginolyticus TaxID=59839 RepID=A0ABT4GNQ8_9BACL|nr:SWIM zinc finger family protein [Paenibacillus alginolyticus]MCY9697841.1 hypothetical protein [Paenibacillus alginolyticus]MEC0141893.1 hypothetical protein [Paenibacillus alginolyticus]
MSSPIINDDQWLQLLEYVAETYSDVTLSRGFTYFKQQRVASLIISDTRVVQAKVEEGESGNYRVTLNLDKPRSSQCSCPVPASCKHMAAVWMELGDRLGYPASQIMNAKMHLKRITSTTSLESTLLQLPKMDVSGWQKFLNHYTSLIKSTYDLGNYVDMLRKQLQNITKITIPFSDKDQIFFDMHQELFILRKLKEQNVQGGVSSYTSFTLYRVYDEIHTWLKQKSPLLNFSVAGVRLEQTLSYIRQQMAEESGHYYQDYGVYTALWKHWVAPDPEASHYVTKEIEALETMTVDSPSPSLSAVKAFLYLQQSRSKDAWEALEENGIFKEAPAKLFIPFFDYLYDTQNWEELVNWLRRSASFFNRKRTKELDVYADLWTKAIVQLPQAEEHMWTVLEELLPYSFRIIEEMLYEQRKWKPWLEMQIIQGHDPLYHRVNVLQPIEKETPKLLLPYYHQAIDHYVSLKNRHDYKLAVRLLKRLDKVYKKMKQTERWEHFFSGFVERHSRLRALQEELRKGKLLG